MQNRIPLLIFAIGMLIVLGSPVSAADSYSYSIMHISDTQFLTATYPSTLNHTFSTLESMKNEYNISAIIITGDLVDDGNNLSQWTNYVQARSLTTIPLYEIPGNHDLKGQADNPLFDEFVGNKYEWNSTINDFIFLGIGYRGNPLNDSEILSERSVIEENPQKFSLIAVHNYYDENLSVSLLGQSIKDNLVLKPTFVLTGHAHASTLHSGLVNNTLFVVDLTNYQAKGNYSAGKLYTVYCADGDVSNITVRDVFISPRQYLDPEITVYDRTGMNIVPAGGESPPDSYISSSASRVSPPLYSPEYFINPGEIIIPATAKVFELADGIEDTLDQRYIPGSPYEED